MAIIKGYNGVVHVDGNPVAQVREFEFAETVERMDSTIMGQPYETAAGGLSSGTVTIQTWMDPADATGQEALTPGAEVSITLYPDGVGSGKPQRVFPAVIETVTIPQTAREHVGRNFDAWVNGVVDRTAQA